MNMIPKRALDAEQRLRDRYPEILRKAGLDEDTINELMADYDSPVVLTTVPKAPADLHDDYVPPEPIRWDRY